MSTRSSDETKLQEAKRRLLEEGVKLYVPGMNAIGEFQREVQARCRRVLEGRRADHAKSLGIDLASLQLEDYDAVDPNEGCAYVGMMLKTRGFWLGYYLFVQAGNGKELSISACADVELGLKSAAALEKAFKKFDSAGVKRERGSVWVDEELTSDQMGAFEEKLDEVVSRWLKLWEGIGGLDFLSGSMAVPHD